MIEKWLLEGLAREIKVPVGSLYNSVNRATLDLTQVERFIGEIQRLIADYRSALAKLNAPEPEPVSDEDEDEEEDTTTRLGLARQNYAFRVPSRSTPGAFHEIYSIQPPFAKSREFYCGCPAGKFGNKCWAVKSVMAIHNTPAYWGDPRLLDFGTGKVTRLDAPYAGFADL